MERLVCKNPAYLEILPPLIYRRIFHQLHHYRRPRYGSMKMVTDCKTRPKLQNPFKDPARLNWHEVKKVDHYWLKIDALTEPMQVREESIPYGHRDK